MKKRVYIFQRTQTKKQQFTGQEAVDVCQRSPLFELYQSCKAGAALQQCGWAQRVQFLCQLDQKRSIPSLEECFSKLGEGGLGRALILLGAPSLRVGRKLERLFRGLMLSGMFESVKSETCSVVSSPGIESVSPALQVDSFPSVCNLFLSVLAFCNNSRNYWVGKIP